MQEASGEGTAEGSAMTGQTFRELSGRTLAAVRKRAGLSQARLAKLAGIGRHAVIYWENKPKVDRNGWAPTRMFEVLGIEVLPDFQNQMRARAWGLRPLRSV